MTRVGPSLRHLSAAPATAYRPAVVGIADVRSATQAVDVRSMSNHNLTHPAIELFPDLLDALDWCGRRIAQGLQEEVSVASGVVAVGATVGDGAAELPASA